MENAFGCAFDMTTLFVTSERIHRRLCGVKIVAHEQFAKGVNTGNAIPGDDSTQFVAENAAYDPALSPTRMNKETISMIFRRRVHI